MKSPLILVVDDEVATVSLLKDVLKLEGFDVVEAYDGLECLEKARSSPVDVILLDVNMPKLDGWEACRQLKATPQTQSIPVIFLSAYAQKHEVEKGLALGAVNYIAKPIDIAELIRIVRQTLGMDSK